MGSYAMVSEGVQKCGGRIGRVNAWAPFLGKGDGSVWSVPSGYPIAGGEAGGGDYFGVPRPVSGSGTSTPGSTGTGMSTPGTPMVSMSPMYPPSTPSSLSVGAPLARSRSPLNGTTSGTGPTPRRPVNPYHPSYAPTSTGTFSSTSGSSMPSPTRQHATPATSFALTTSTRPSTSSASISIDDVDAEEEADEGPEVKGHARAPSTFALAKKTIATAPTTLTDSGTTSTLEEDQTGMWAAGDNGAFVGMEGGNDRVMGVGRRPQFGQYAAYGK
ncbi:hypothetical protein G7K_1746-t1 [Saitoella complicata NRRL Y-17804]|uniref:Uncharacterized protein n=2 Tax=Saitoella complicata (strain BCRC 22490 / CBS 7301 / JCM 7358 / NBRC 10748 / NRRL Y-17804) TaxID=698492 RepID=A0A0E9NCW5_SAICN|nr:hypothetical protein G7K_1746-t1 [Saitoella complicata NRRL Y-17804]